jgi:hypothetical protein
MNDTFLDQPMKSVMKIYIAGEILQVYSHLVRRQRNAVIIHCVTTAEKILLVYPKLYARQKSILVYIVLSMKSLGFDRIHFKQTYC